MRGLEYLLLGLLFMACGFSGTLLLGTTSALSVAIVGMLLVLFGIYDVVATARS